MVDKPIDQIRPIDLLKATLAKPGHPRELEIRELAAPTLTTSRSIQDDLLGIKDEELYSDKEFTNGKQYKTALIRGSLGARPADVILLRLAEDRDGVLAQSKKTIVLTVGSTKPQLLKERLCRGVEDFNARKYLFEHSGLIETVEKKEATKNICFFDFNKLRVSIGQKVKSPPAGKTAEGIIKEEVRKFVRDKQLQGTGQIYITNAEEFTTDIGYSILQELASCLLPNHPPRIFALAQHDYAHGDAKSPRTLCSVFGGATLLQPLSAFVATGEVPNITYHPMKHRSYDTSPATLNEITRNRTFNGKLKDAINASLARGDKKIFVRVRDTHALTELIKTLRKEKPQIDIGYFSSVAHKGLKNGPQIWRSEQEQSEELGSARMLLSRWGDDYKVLVHCGIFDRLEEPADTVIVGDHIVTDDKFENAITPLRTRGRRNSQDAHLYYFTFGDENFDARKLIEGYDQRMKSGFGAGFCSRVLGSSFRAKGASAVSSAAQVDDAQLVETIIDFSDRRVAAINNFWQSILKPEDLVRYLREYLNQRQSQLGGALDDYERELRYVLELVNGQRRRALSQLDHSKRTICEFVLKKAGKDITEMAATYPAIFGIENLAEAGLRVFTVYKPNYAVYKSSKLLERIDALSSRSLPNEEARWRHRSNLIGEFLFAREGGRHILEDQELHNGCINNERLATSLQEILGITDSHDQSSLKQGFERFLAAKESEKKAKTGLSGIAFGIGNEQWQSLVDDYILENNTELLDGDVGVLASSQNTLLKALETEAAIEGAANAETFKFFRYVAGRYPEKCKLAELVQKRPELVGLQSEDEKLARMSFLMQDYTRSPNTWLSFCDSIFHRSDDTQLPATRRAQVLLAFLKSQNLGFDTSARLVGQDSLPVLLGARNPANAEERTLLRNFMHYIASQSQYSKSLRKSLNFSASVAQSIAEQAFTAMKARFSAQVGIEGSSEALFVLKEQLHYDLKQHPKSRSTINAQDFFDNSPKTRATPPAKSDAALNYVRDFCAKHSIEIEDLFREAGLEASMQGLSVICTESEKILPPTVRAEVQKIIDSNFDNIRATFLINSLLSQEQQIQSALNFSNKRGWHATASNPQQFYCCFLNDTCNSPEEVNFRTTVQFLLNHDGNDWQVATTFWNDDTELVLEEAIERAQKNNRPERASLFAQLRDDSIFAVKPDLFGSAALLGTSGVLKNGRAIPKRSILDDIKTFLALGTNKELVRYVRSYVEDTCKEGAINAKGLQWGDLAYTTLRACAGEVFAGSDLYLRRFMVYCVRKTGSSAARIIANFSDNFGVKALIDEIKEELKKQTNGEDAIELYNQLERKFEGPIVPSYKSLRSQIHDAIFKMLNCSIKDWNGDPDAASVDLKCAIGYIQTGLMNRGWDNIRRQVFLNEVAGEDSSDFFVTLDAISDTQPKILHISISKDASRAELSFLDEGAVVDVETSIYKSGKS